MRKIVVVIPTYNEAQNIAPIITRVREFEPTVDILVVDDNSPDGTAGIVESLMKKDAHLSLLNRKGKEGLGKAYIHAFMEVMKDPSVEWIQMLDADFSHDPKYLPALFAQTATADVVIGSRYVQGGGTVGWSFWKRWLSRFANGYCRFITGMPIHDSTAGFILMPTTLMRKIHLEDMHSRGHAFMMELKHRLWKQGARIAEVPVVLEDRFHGKSKMSRGVILEAVGAPWKLKFQSGARTDGAERESQGKPLACALCGAPHPVFFKRKNNCTLYACTACKFWFVYPVPEVSDVYTKDYFVGADSGFGYVDYESDKKPMVSTNEQYVKLITTYVPQRGRLLDVGAATGFFLSIAQRLGFDPHGVEMSDYAAGEARGKGLPVITGTLADVPPAPLFDAITMIDVIEHVTDPRTEVTRVNALLKSGGIFAIDTQNTGSLYARLLRTRWHLIVPPEHLNYFNRENITLLLTQCGFEVLEITTVGKRFSLPYIFNMLHTWQKLWLWQTLARVCERGLLSKIYIPINLRDTMFVVAQKK
jgi:dolichol-phosphate mannosyltransferase